MMVGAENVVGVTDHTEELIWKNCCQFNASNHVAV